MNGEKFLDKIFKDLYLSDEVNHTALVSNDKYENIRLYMERLERVHNRATTEYKKNLVRRMYYDKYVIKEAAIPDNRDKENIIMDQRKSLDKWIDYLTSDDVKWPMWVKYWVFQGVLKIGTYDESHDVYMKRSKKTIAPFMELNSEVLIKCVELILKHVNKESITDDELNELVESGSFEKIYHYFSKKYHKTIVDNSDKFDGVWIKYQMESIAVADEKEKKGEVPEYLKLYNSLQERGTGWCTAASASNAKAQICGGRYIFNYYKGGDFYCYYTKDLNGKYKIPRISIRMEGHDKIAEIRGIDSSQNVELGMEGIVESKLSEMDFLTKDDVSKYLKIIDNMKKITDLNRKFAKGEEFSIEELRVIYQLDKKLESFSLFDNDERIGNIVKRLDNKMMYEKFGFEDKVKFLVSLTRNFRLVRDDFKINDREVLLKAISVCFDCIEHVDDSLFDDRDFMLDMIKVNERAFFRVTPRLKSDEKFIMEAVLVNHYVYYCLDNQTLVNDKFRRKIGILRKWKEFQDGVSGLVSSHRKR